MRLTVSRCVQVFLFIIILLPLNLYGFKAEAEKVHRAALGSEKSPKLKTIAQQAKKDDAVLLLVHVKTVPLSFHSRPLNKSKGSI